MSTDSQLTDKILDLSLMLNLTSSERARAFFSSKVTGWLDTLWEEGYNKAYDDGYDDGWSARDRQGTRGVDNGTEPLTVGDRVAYVDHWGPGPYLGTVVRCQGESFYVDWDGTESPLVVQRRDRLHRLKPRTASHPDAEVNEALTRVVDGLNDLYARGYRLGNGSPGFCLFKDTETVSVLRDETNHWGFEVNVNPQENH